MTELWQTIIRQAEKASLAEPALASFFYAHILNHSNLTSCLSFSLAERLGSHIVPATLIRDVVDTALEQETGIMDAAVADMLAVYDRDPACDTYLMPLLFFKGYQALQAYRVSHYLWQQQRFALAMYFQSLINERFDVDIHPGAIIGQGIMLDHATGIVIGETTVIGDNVSILHSVTLGGSGCSNQKRHPTIESGVLIATGAKLLGAVVIGENAKIAAGSVVVDSVESYSTVAGVPAKVVKRSPNSCPALNMEQSL